MGETWDPAEILDEGLQGFDDRASGISTLMIIYRSMRLFAWIEGGKRRLNKVRVDRREAAIGNAQRAFEVYLGAKGVRSKGELGEAEQARKAFGLDPKRAGKRV